MEITRVGVDLAKNVFQVHGVDGREKPVWLRQLTQSNWLTEICKRVPPGSEIGLEACGGSHHWARCLRERGYQPKLMAPQFVKPYVKSNKTDRNDAEAICEAMSRPTMRFVPIKSTEQQDLQALHRVRSEMVRARTQKANQIRGLVGEYGLVAPIHLASLRRVIPGWLEDADNGLSLSFRRLLAGLRDDLQRLDERIDELNSEMLQIAKSNENAQRLQQIVGVGPVVATALIASLGDGRAFRRGRDYAVSLGLTPRQHSSGGKERLLGISKRGDGYVRQLLVHGARSALRTVDRRDDKLSHWLQHLQQNKHPNVATVALANKIARIAWAIVRDGRDYNPSLAASR